MSAVSVVVLGAAVMAGAAPGVSSAGAVSGVWGTARELPGLAGAAQAEILGLSCAAPGDCAAGGFSVGVNDDSATSFVADEVKGTWGRAQDIVPWADGNDALVFSVACPSAGNCAAAGIYSDLPPVDDQVAYGVFVADEKDGKWGTGVAATGAPGLNTNDLDRPSVSGISCPSAGNCVVVGEFPDNNGIDQAYLLAEVRGTWQTGVEVPGMAALNGGAGATVTSVSCASAGNCAVGGSYWTSTAETQSQPFVASQTNGTWHSAITVPGTSAVTGAGASVQAMSCPRAGNCVAAGSDGPQFAVTDVNGTWGNAVTIAGIGAIGTLSCPASGDCAAGGTISAGTSVGGTKAALVTETNGTWGKPVIVPGLTGIPGAQDSAVTSVSCASPGNCTAGGDYQYQYQNMPDGGSTAFAVTELNGTWARLNFIPGVARLDTNHSSAITAVSCTAPATCTAAGDTIAGNVPFPFVTGETRAQATSTALALSAARITYGHEQSGHITVRVTAASGTPAGKVTVRAGTVTACLITLTSGKGACTLTARRLKPGTYHLVASYPGTPFFTGSASAPKTLTVAK
jgi:hypothetical protein